MLSASSLELKLIALAVHPGTYTNCAAVVANNEVIDPGNTVCTKIVVEGDVPPTLSLKQLGPAQLELTLQTEGPLIYTIQRSADLKDWTDWRPGVKGPSWSEKILIDSSISFYRAK